MKLEELYANLSLGVLSNLTVGDEGSGFIRYEHQAKVCLAINNSLTAIYGKFILNVKEVRVRAMDNKTLYPLKQIHADQDPTIGVDKFITDTVDEPFTGDVLRILEVYDEAGEQLVLNDPTGLGQIYAPNPTTLQIVQPVSENTYFVLYQARHTKLVPDDLEQEIELPEILMPALEAHVAYLIMSPMNGQEHSMKAAEHYAKYNMVCEEVIEKDLVSTSIVEHSTKMQDRGWK